MYGWIVSDISVWKSIKRLGITGYIRKQKNPETEGSEHNRYANVLNRGFQGEKPKQLLNLSLEDSKMFCVHTPNIGSVMT